tara:strand:- start:384 stop:515 length:132 start_codon:yes stop_codon:yes gene_type:complete
MISKKIKIKELFNDVTTQKVVEQCYKNGKKKPILQKENGKSNG